MKESNSVINKLKKIKVFLNGDSWQSTIANIILAFVIVKFLLLPGLSIITDSDYPVVAVVSQSMQHDNPILDKRTNFDDWFKYHETYYNLYNITKERFLEFPQKNGFNIGDILVIYGKDFGDLEIGDVIVFEGNLEYPIIHRIINISLSEDKKNTIIQTKGDNNAMSIDDVRFSELNITKEDYYGTALFKIPYLGLIKIYFFKLLGLA